MDDRPIFSALPDNLSKLILDNLPCSIVYFDSNGYALFANQYYRHRLGVDPENLQGRHWSELLNHPNQEVALAVKKAYQQKKPVHFEGEIHYFQGSTREVSAHYIPHLDQQQNVQGLYALIDDQTLSRRAELALKESEKRWRDLVDVGIGSRGVGCAYHGFDADVYAPLQPAVADYPAPTQSQ